MRLQRVDHSADGGGDGPNEDLAGQSGPFAWIIDGATPVEQPVMDSETDARWLACHIDEQLREFLPQAPRDVPLEQVIRRLRRSVRVHMGAHLVPGNVDPVCSLGIAHLVDDDELVVAVLGDVSIMSCGPDGLRVATNQGFGSREATAARQSRLDIPPDERRRLVRAGVAKRRRQYIAGVDDLQVFSPRMPEEFELKTYSWSVRPDSFILLVSDGLTRLFESYGVYPDAERFFESIVNDGVDAAIKLLRSTESGSSTERHLKSADDATGLLLRVSDV